MGLNNEEVVDKYEVLGEDFERTLPENRFHKPTGAPNYQTNLKERRRFDIQEKSEASLAKHLKRFDRFSEPEKTERLKAYFAWRDESQSKGYVTKFEEEDLTETKGTGWANALHKPSLIDWTESGRPTSHSNEINALDRLYIMLEEHLEAWKHVSTDFRKNYTLEKLQAPPLP